MKNIFVTSASNVFIGTINPSQKLHIVTGETVISPITGFLLNDGNQKSGCVLTSDHSGKDTWKPASITKIIGTLGSGVDVPFSSTNFKRTLSYIDLPPGKWEVSVTMLLPVETGTLTINDWVWIRSSFSTLNQTTIVSSEITSDILGSNLTSSYYSGPKNISGTPKFDMMRGTVVIQNSSGSTKRYCYYAGLNDSHEYSLGSGKANEFGVFGGSNWAKNNITASPILK
ncbi:hypothetical protein CHRY9390_02437 [Chryseobacterium aquaeductus]|uniref:Uncharacterized protein n=1 Tax=Chryseobacterium aquaeductus TaxID=2675056 RepID=A0A9N8QVC3_9FLAO|nr:hypothetical protein [Chryseobacterium aquaeductus]CAA7331723.1 hypothetical protein CHRY9390_02437 [Chryseobacterium potabilaquae]CAD7811922.1 hypothetical protein CHRY9390_02437 [Chryseobacterium aquaeductus]